MFGSMAEMVQRARDAGTSCWRVVLDEDLSQITLGEDEVLGTLRSRLATMREAVALGLEGKTTSLSGLSGGGAHRFRDWSRGAGGGGEGGERGPLSGPFCAPMIARALATMEINAAMGRIVASPTAGSAGILPAIFLTLEEVRGIDEETLLRGLITAGGIGGVFRARASLSGAEGGCQAETGSAAAMAAGAVVEMLGGAPAMVSEAVSFTIQGMLGLICDPLGGLVEIPCITRNVSAAMQAVAAADMALAGLTFPIPADEVLDVMGEIGRELPERYRETGLGGLAATPTGQLLKIQVMGGELA
ncbi:MAG: L-serine ammonia-lyase, iron-sulfur-dependent, subunit alpha [Gemmatimonadetes bacterium]|nr:L-serine ammonia-lyase, iron-sulfur-dependent, subunit alpha [Gemmatimonadota bacterium]